MTFIPFHLYSKIQKMQNQFSRTELLLGKPAIETLHQSHVAVFGVGGVGGYVVEVLARSGIGTIDIIDNDRVCLSNINRQIIATHSSIGRLKVDVAEERIHDINPECKVTKYPMFYLPSNADEIDLSAYDYVVDCIDTVTAKLNIIQRCHKLGVPIISCLGAARKLDATRFEVTDLFRTTMDPLAKILRKKLRKTDVEHLKVVYSPEEPLDSIITEDTPEEERSVPASNAWVPATAGLICGGEVVKDLIKR
jgi:tRNA A37 threonylcarbamoyladenosine dehydratase